MNVRSLLECCSCLLALGIACPAQAPSAPPLASFEEWSRAPWSASDRAYSDTRAAIDAEMKRGTPPSQLAARYRPAAEAQPDHPLVQFRWAYATYCARVAIAYGPARQRLVYPAMQALRVPRFPGSYEYARLRFILEGWLVPSMPLLSLGERLLQRSRHDPDVLYVMVPLMGLYGTQATAERAVQYANELVDSRPNAAAYRDLVGAAYDYLWVRWHRAQDARRAISAFREAMRLAPASGLIPRWKHMISGLERDLEAAEAIGGHGKR